MNIKEAKQEIINTIRAYTLKDEAGRPVIPYEKQRPLLLMGPPGIGKTAIMQQVALECGIGLTSYTITHHTRQSAVGLPFIAKRIYDGNEYSVTEYTMSEIIASVYEQIERTGVREGILFLDEINCVSETLSPTMLQFLQYKTFGTHRVPEGYIIVTAGNPPQYNRSVRDFDIVTLDRVRKIDITEDLAVWKEYAGREGVHGAVMAYLEIHPDHFYSVRADIEEQYFVTARGWEDLSRVIRTYEELMIPVTEALVTEYLQDPQIASSFAAYYELYNKYKDVYRIPEILEGSWPGDLQAIGSVPFDEKLSLIGLLTDSLGQEFREYAARLAVQERLQKLLGETRGQLKAVPEGKKADTAQILQKLRTQTDEERKKRSAAGMIGREEEEILYRAAKAMKELEEKLLQESSGLPAEDFSLIRNWFENREEERLSAISRTSEHLTNSFAFLSEAFGEGQEMVIFLTDLSAGYYSLKFVSDCGNEAYYKYNRLLLLDDRRSRMREEIRKLIVF